MKDDWFNQVYYSTDGYDDYLTNYIKQGEQITQKLLNNLELKPTAKILDVGCGMGGTVMAFRKRGLNAIGTEISKYCLKNSPVKRHLHRAGVISLPFKNNQFDLVICQDVLCYLNPKQIFQAIKELSGITNHYLYLEVITKHSPNAKQSINPDKLRKSENLLTKKQWLKILTQENLQPIKKLFKDEENPDFNYLFKKIKP